ncbi:MAG TPA: LLM class flavin-dependent oxidoreductase [Dehalococcoidia bacterium]|jgi:alkanesulfonate monooxygenase SsuD/methylene tetrahydromethanopterin reductase-like flavin-dependent oxidoreductase (luciferase family)
MHFGLTLPNFGPYADARLLAALAREAEATGWEGFFLWDHVLFGSLPVVDPWVALSAVALATERIRLGPLVTPLPRRRPVKLAREAVSLDHLSNGRLVLGAGSGLLSWELEDLGEVADLKTRAAMLDEGLGLLTALWSGRPVNHRGEHYRVEAMLPGASEPAAFLPAPLQTPRIPIWLAATWPHKRPFRRAARWDGVAPMKAGQGLDERLTPDDLRAIVAYLRTQRGSMDGFDVVVAGTTAGADRAADAATVGPYAETGATWWLERIDPWRHGWAWHGPWPVERMNARISLGPPRP